jgi:hypothetical protein
MTPWWLTFTDGTHGCVEARTLDIATTKAEDLTGKVVTVGKKLPYLAVPVLYQESTDPAFCHSPDRCAGRSSCPMDYACTE